MVRQAFQDLLDACYHRTFMGGRPRPIVEKVVQVSTADRGPEGLLVFCRDLGGAEIARLQLEMASRVAELRLRLAGQLGVPLGSLELVGAGGALGPTDMLAALGCSVEASSDHGAAQDPEGPSDRPLKRRRAE